MNDEDMKAFFNWLEDEYGLTESTYNMCTAAEREEYLNEYSSETGTVMEDS